jgi:hypothetical protein
LIINQATNTNSFIYCNVYQGAHETTTYFNGGAGHYHRSIYLSEGSVEYTVTESETLDGNEIYLPLESGILYDISHTKGKYVITRTNDVGSVMSMFNPIPEDKELDIKVLRGPLTRDVVAEDKRITAVCLSGPIIIKDKTLHSLQYAVIFPNKSAHLNLSEHSLCALVTG